MKFILRIVIGASLFIVINACNYSGEKSTSRLHSDTMIDSVKKENEIATKGLENSIESNSIVRDYIKGYSDTIKIDTSFNYKGENVNISFQHFCTYDSTIHLPIKFVGIYGLKEFITHDFKSTLKIVSGQHLVLDTTISKVMFKDIVFKEEDMYGVLLYPNLSFSSNKLSIDYSISIPLTDIGVGVSLECDYSGKLIIKPR